MLSPCIACAKFTFLHKGHIFFKINIISTELVFYPQNFNKSQKVAIVY